MPASRPKRPDPVAARRAPAAAVPPARSPNPAPAPAAAPALSTLAELGSAWKQSARQRAEAERAARAQAMQQAREAELQARRLRLMGLAAGLGTPPAPPRDERADHELFTRSVGAVQALPDHGRAELEPPRPAPLPRQREADEQAALAASLSDEVTLESLLLTDDGLSFRRPGIGPDVVARLRRGHWALQGQIDLHGYTRDEARELLADYLRECHRRGMRCVRVVHGKGHGSPRKQPVLKGKVQRWLAQRDEVIAFAQASGPQGGAGALVVLLSGH